MSSNSSSDNVADLAPSLDQLEAGFCLVGLGWSRVG